MATLLPLQFRNCPSPPPPKLHRSHHLHAPTLALRSKSRLLSSISWKLRVFSSIYCLCKSNSDVQSVSGQDELQRPPFDINLAVVLAGFAFEAYSSPPENVGRREVDAADCTTVFLSESFVRELYDGQLVIKLKKGLDFPAMDPWGTSDPYVVIQLDGQVVKSNVKWGTKEPTWNEEFSLNIKLPPTKNLQVAAWDANLVTPHKRMGNAAISLECLCDGNLHEVLLELEGMGGGGKIQLEVKYKSFKEIDEEKNWWKVPFVSEFLRKNGFESAMKMVLSSETVQARQFVQHAFGQLSLSNDAYLQKNQFSNIDKYERESTESKSSVLVSDTPPQLESSLDGSSNDTSSMDGSNLQDFGSNNAGKDNGNVLSVVPQIGDRMQSDKYFWNNFGDLINQSVVQKLGFPAPEKINWDGFDLLKGIGLQSRRIAEATYIESGLATPKSQDVVDDGDDTTGPLNFSTIQSSLPDIRKATQDIMSQTDSILGALMVLTAAVSQLNKEGRLSGKDDTKENDSNKKEDDVSEYFRIEKFSGSQEGSVVDERKAEEMKALFSKAETAMEAWAMLATSLGHPSLIKSEFEKICFLDNPSTDTQVAIWRDSARRRLVVAFRGTEQARWKDLRTDLMLVPAGLNPERIGGDFKQEIQVHSGFLSAYDSVRTRIISLIKLLVGYIDDGREMQLKWHVYVTGHSLGGALATLLALELSSSQLAKRGVISVTMYNFGSPRVGNKRFAEVYNEENMELLGDGYQGDVIGESTPDVLVNEFMKGEKELIERILHTEINIFRSIRDGSALMQHMEDFYYITLLENVRSNYQIVARSQTTEEDSLSIS
ncbi:uncharacterized protein LOC100249309 isoform X3 [Vitis vinifera]|uniref:uncharacterized protein LOC100249309 isoform X3 n=1 Tax=Vitis vinifera TaxID=29760 RepID=UPI0005401084|nr:uncharacterized protein LOC100249309 isoform X3 [Vitis vinifera]|eukprot:XP_010645211.1 PREDICTED: uncharacterized protein LOC100249309 isoform X2 [Vitis vinifera]